MHKILLLMLLVGLLVACSHKPKLQSSSQRESVMSVMQQHLNAVSNKNLISLAETLPPNGQMQLILPGTEIIDSVAGFLKFHEDWFSDSDWTFETEILNATVGKQLAMVVVQIIYREPMRDGKPYFNRMTVSYDLQNIEGKWYVIKDHASSVEKSTTN
jgi:ketosteroid isomerase-like protein